MMLDKVPPHSMDAEQSVLGSMLLAPEAIAEVRTIITRKDFYRESHGVLFEVMCQMQDEGTPVDLTLLPDELLKKNRLDKVGGITYVASLANIVPTAANAGHYARVVREKAVARRLIQTAGALIEKAYGDYESIEGLIGEAQRGIFNMALETKGQGGLQDAYEIAHEVVDEILLRKPGQGIIGIQTGFRKLDVWTAGFHPGQLIVVAARPAMGKTSWAIQVAGYAAIFKKKRVAVFSLETSRQKIIEKLLVNHGMIDGQRVRLGVLNTEEEKKLIDAAGRIAQSSVMIDDTPRITVHEILARCRKAKLEKGLDLVVIDYIQQISGNNRTATRDREIGEITRALKMMALELKVPILALSQLSRAVEHTQDKRPSLSHLRESGSIEADADVVMFIYRPEYYFPEKTEVKGKTEIIVAKQREGPVGTVVVEFLKEFTRFTDPVYEWSG